MPINPANANELATIAREVGVEVVEGDQRYRSGAWQLADVMVSDSTGELAGYNASFWRDTTWELPRVDEELAEKQQG
jgi:hypothetical protein